MLSKVANVAAFQLTWWASVLGAADSKRWIGPASVSYTHLTLPTSDLV